MNIPILIHYKNKVYRPAGYRLPTVGEIYVGPDGHLKTTGTVGPSVPRLVVREYNKEKDFKGAPRKWE